MFDVLVLGSGVAGLTTALHAARAGPVGARADEGRAVALGDPLRAGWRRRRARRARLARPAPRRHARRGRGPVRRRRGARARHRGSRPRARARRARRPLRHRDPAPTATQLLLAREGGHSLARVVHAGGDATGAEIERALVAAVERSRHRGARRLVRDRAARRARPLHAACSRCGPTARSSSSAPSTSCSRPAASGQCFAVTTNPTLSTGDGIALALKAGVACADLEFVQFHPTALHHPSMPRPLLSEALRGEGAVLRDDDGVAFMAGVHPLADLAPRDVVARAIHERMRETGDRPRLARRDDDRRLRNAASRRSGARARPSGSIRRSDWLPVAPAAHYLSGGVVTDLDGATTLPHLWACGEAACSGVHGANRLASNSLLDGLVFGRRVVEAIVAGKDGAESTGAMTGVLDLAAGEVPTPTRSCCRKADADATRTKLRGAVQRTMSADCGVVRDAAGLAARGRDARAISRRSPTTFPARTIATLRGAATCCASRARSSPPRRAREESRGAHTARRLPRDRPTRCSAGSCSRGDAAPVFVAAARRTRCGTARR